MKIALIIALALFITTSCGETEPVAKTESAVTTTMTVGNLFSETQFSGQGWLGHDINYITYSAVMPGLPWNPSTAGWAFMAGLYYMQDANGTIGLNRIFAKCTRNTSTYHCQWDLFWGDTAGNQYQALDAVSATAYPGDRVYFVWYGYNQGSNTHTAYVDIFKPDGSLRQQAIRGDMGFQTTLYPNAEMDPSFQFQTVSGYSCTDTPAPDDDVNYNGSMGFDTWYGFNGFSPVHGIYALGAGQDSTNTPCELDWHYFGATTPASVLYWHAH